MTDPVSPEPPFGLVTAQRIAIAAAEHAVTAASPGMSESELAELAESHARSLGATGFWTITNVGFGAGSLRCFPTEPPTGRALWSLDVGHVDVHPITAEGWWGDCTRTLVRGEVPEYRHLSSEMEEVHRRLLASARPGMPANELYGIFRGEVERLDLVALDRLHNIGHSLGRSTSYDFGYIDAHNASPMFGAWAIEPFFGNHLYGVKLEDVVWFGAAACTVVH
jgi:Xaa-Pro aminopeptidase